MPASISLSQGPPNEAWTPINDYDASNNTIYTGLARSTQPNAYAFTVTSVSKAAAAVVTITAHGLQSDNIVTIAGGTDDWAGINGDQRITVTGADTFTIPVDTSAYADDFAGTITSRAPRTNSAVWAIQKNYFDARNNLSRSAWCSGNPSPVHVWADRTTLKFQ